MGDPAESPALVIRGWRRVSLDYTAAPPQRAYRWVNSSEPGREIEGVPRAVSEYCAREAAKPAQRPCCGAAPLTKVTHCVFVVLVVAMQLALYGAYTIQLCGDWYGGSGWPPEWPGKWAGRTPWILSGVATALQLLTLWAYLACLFRSPGYVPRRFYAPVGDAMEPEVMDRLPRCVPCATYKPERAHHCRKCGVCVLRFDHHCPWIAQCVGFRNHKVFLNLLTWACIAALWFVGSATPAVVSLLGHGAQWKHLTRPTWYRWAFLAAFVCALITFINVMPLCWQHWRLAGAGLTGIEELRIQQALKSQRDSTQPSAVDSGRDAASIPCRLCCCIVPPPPARPGQVPEDPRRWYYGLRSTSANLAAFFGDSAEAPCWTLRLLPLQPKLPHDGTHFCRPSLAPTNYPECTTARSTAVDAAGWDVGADSGQRCGDVLAGEFADAPCPGAASGCTPEQGSAGGRPCGASPEGGAAEAEEEEEEASDPGAALLGAAAGPPLVAIG
eukprot:TRINITY_DN12961_c0_g1_i1.p1 TRINITY_DN12961_c0_g1~~TRINITY_DN12961_c0_g1_i1.p1  ORF type:complete len:532 (+),score=90.76 TRINITY_DN12961_c0_g1_i1:100-1596(+)